MMEFWQKMVFPVRRLWFAVSTRVNSHTKNGGGLLKLHNDVQSCGYEDVQVMWEMLRRSSESSSEVMSSSSSSTNHRNNKRPPAKNNRSFWRIFVWSSSNNNSSASSLSTHRA